MVDVLVLFGVFESGRGLDRIDIDVIGREPNGGRLIGDEGADELGDGRGTGITFY